MGGRAEDPIQSTAGRPPREEEKKGRLYSYSLSGEEQMKERERDSTTPRFYDSAVGPDGYVERPVLHSAGT